MDNIAADLLALVKDERALTILKLEDGWMITFADLSQDGDDIFFVPHKVMLSTATLEEALSKFHQEKFMEGVSGYQA